ncbi:hypothetical protein M0R45_019529 [Rubus argutus]|uniref:Uncharacterized protein n=1 Tax=Rubus argutus TaxID=59490 RepID=A0AAW1X7K3_RUBAR
MPRTRAGCRNENKEKRWICSAVSSTNRLAMPHRNLPTRSTTAAMPVSSPSPLPSAVDLSHHRRSRRRQWLHLQSPPNRSSL